MTDKMKLWSQNQLFTSHVKMSCLQVCHSLVPVSGAWQNTHVMCCNGLPPNEKLFEWRTSQYYSVVFLLFVFQTKFGSVFYETPLTG
jgi:hypothetical protein